MKKILLFFSELNNGDLDWFVQKGKKETIQPNRLLMREGQVSEALYIVVSGSFSVVIESQDHKELATISAGEIVGEVSFIDTRPPLASVRSLEESVVLSIPRMQLLSKLQQDVGFSSRFYRAICLCLSDRLRGTVNRLGYGYDGDDLALHFGEFGQSMISNLELAEAKFNWLIKNVRGS
ncbi:cyclic nucleotide-binding domain-containing protein [Pseudanabaena sp. ABRG5-3]|uniref:cyclic nucleotide-binding domain-containing protein n=1 Tax=Pseudanabaena sp. ABRG5-3 TaxID=685565 RepID=UPI000DC708FF|nr:cyclic nucleotide-binding domain-containing protein [Pseudanabaena sp. ABRG5-3]BBC25216.1 cyclic nucleotide-binding protein [Pseudanabaena sp. ABRG5-3]